MVKERTRKTNNGIALDEHKELRRLLSTEISCDKIYMVSVRGKDKLFFVASASNQ